MEIIKGDSLAIYFCREVGSSIRVLEIKQDAEEGRFIFSLSNPFPFSALPDPKSQFRLYMIIFLLETIPFIII
jgi:hypothetical protein